LGNGDRHFQVRSRGTKRHGGTGGGDPSGRQRRRPRLGREHLLKERPDLLPAGVDRTGLLEGAQGPGVVPHLLEVPGQADLQTGILTIQSDGPSPP